MSRAQRACHGEWRARADRLIGRTRRLPEESPALHRAPASGAWSASQVLEHLVLATASYLGVMRRCVEAAGESEREDPHWRPTWAGRLLAWSMTSQRRFPAPRGWRPPDVPRPHVREAWAGELRELVALLDRAAVLPWNRLRFRSPAAPLIRLNLGDGFHIVVLHAERHSGQIDRALALSPSDGASTG